MKLVWRFLTKIFNVMVNVYNVKVIDDCMVIHTFPARRH